MNIGNDKKSHIPTWERCRKKGFCCRLRWETPSLATFHGSRSIPFCFMFSILSIRGLSKELQTPRQALQRFLKNTTGPGEWNKSALLSEPLDVLQLPWNSTKIPQLSRELLSEIDANMTEDNSTKNNSVVDNSDLEILRAHSTVILMPSPGEVFLVNVSCLDKKMNLVDATLKAKVLGYYIVGLLGQKRTPISSNLSLRGK